MGRIDRYPPMRSSRHSAPYLPLGHILPIAYCSVKNSGNNKQEGLFHAIQVPMGCIANYSTDIHMFSESVTGKF